MDNSKTEAIEQDALIIKSILDKYSLEGERFQLSSALKKVSNVALDLYHNPKMVAVALVPILDDYNFKLLGVKRGISPKIGESAFAGGFVDEMEDAITAVCREVKEETGMVLDPTLFKIVEQKLTPGNQVLIFCLYQEPIPKNFVDFSFNCKETQEVILIDEITPLCFPLHEDMKTAYFKQNLAPSRKIKNK